MYDKGTVMLKCYLPQEKIDFKMNSSCTVITLASPEDKLPQLGTRGVIMKVTF